MKKLLDSKDKSVAQNFNELTLWSAPFGRLLLENIPMQKGMTVLDIGFGTGFPLIELSQRFGESSKIYGIDIWKEAILWVENKIELLELFNITIIQESAVNIKVGNEQIDLVTSNLGINNFEDKETVYSEIHRVLKPEGRLCITTNPVGTFHEFFNIFDQALADLNLSKGRTALKAYIERRQNKASIIDSFTENGFHLIQSLNDSTNMKFTDAKALLDHSLIRIGFRESWENMLPEDQKERFFNLLIEKIEKEISAKGIFEMTIPMLYLEFQKE